MGCKQMAEVSGRDHVEVWRDYFMLNDLMNRGLIGPWRGKLKKLKLKLCEKERSDDFLLPSFLI